MIKFTPFDNKFTRRIKAAAILGESKPENVIFLNDELIPAASPLVTLKDDTSVIGEIIRSTIQKIEEVDPPGIKSSVSTEEGEGGGEGVLAPFDPDEYPRRMYSFIGSETATFAVIDYSIISNNDESLLLFDEAFASLRKYALTGQNTRNFAMAVASRILLLSSSKDSENIAHRVVKKFLKDEEIDYNNFVNIYNTWIENRNANVKNVKKSASSVVGRDNELMNSSTKSASITKPLISSYAREVVFKKYEQWMGLIDIFANSKPTYSVPFINLFEFKHRSDDRNDFIPDINRMTPAMTPVSTTTVIPLIKVHEPSMKDVSRSNVFPEIIASSKQSNIESIFIIIRRSNNEFIKAVLKEKNGGGGEEEVSIFIYTSSDVTDDEINDDIIQYISSSFEEGLILSTVSSKNTLLEMKGTLALTGKDAENFSVPGFYFMIITHPALRPFIFIKEDTSAFSEKSAGSIYFHIDTSLSSSVEELDDDITSSSTNSSFKFDTLIYAPPTNVSPAILQISFTAESQYLLRTLMVTLSQAIGFFLENYDLIIPTLTNAVPECCPVLSDVKTKIIKETASEIRASKRRVISSRIISESGGVSEILKNNDTISQKITDLHRNSEPGTINAGKCQCKWQPVIITEDEREAWAPRKILDFKNRLFVCPDDTIPYPNVVVNPDTSPSEFPCCQTKEKTTTTAKVTIAPTTTTARFDYVITKHIPLSVNRFGTIPTSLSRLIRAGEKLHIDLIRKGTQQSTMNSMIHACLVSLNNEEYLNQTSPDNRELIANRYRRELLNLDPSIFSQEFPDYNPKHEAAIKERERVLKESISESLSSSSPVNSSLHIRGVEEILDVNIFIFNVTESGQYTWEVPRHAISHLKPSPNLSNKTIILIKHSNDSSYEAVLSRGILVKSDSEGTISSKLAEVLPSSYNTNAGVFSPAATVFLHSVAASTHECVVENNKRNEITRMYASGFDLKSYLINELFKDEFVVSIKNQYIDLYGKLRGVHLSTSSSSFYIRTPPLQPLGGGVKIYGKYPPTDTTTSHEFLDMLKPAVFSNIDKAKHIIYVKATGPGSDSLSGFDFEIIALPRHRLVEKKEENVNNNVLVATLCVQFIFWARANNNRSSSFDEWWSKATKLISSGTILKPPLIKRSVFPSSISALHQLWPQFVSEEGVFIFSSEALYNRVNRFVGRMDKFITSTTTVSKFIRGVLIAPKDFKADIDTRTFTKTTTFYDWLTSYSLSPQPRSIITAGSKMLTPQNLITYPSREPFHVEMEPLGRVVTVLNNLASSRKDAIKGMSSIINNNNKYTILKSRELITDGGGGGGSGILYYDLEEEEEGAVAAIVNVLLPKT